MSRIKDLMVEAGYSNKAIDYYLRKVNVGIIEKPDAFYTYTGQCGDTAEIYLEIKENVIVDAKFQAIGCAGAFVSGSALTEIIKGKTVKAAKEINEGDISRHLECIPEKKAHCICLLKRTLDYTIKEYKTE